jgi:alpha-D-ribose 1-methylphosphonate 5-triphosphate diphosphatase
MTLAIHGGRLLVEGRLTIGDLTLASDGRIDGSATRAARVLDATDLLVLPGIVDIHGDAFERQIEPRPGVGFDLTTALLETDRQLIANGITTAHHGVTWSWEPGLRGPENARALLGTLASLQPLLAADTRYHLRHETFNLDAESEIVGWLSERRIGCLAFNDHMTGTIKARHRPEKMNKMIERSGLGAEAFQALIDRVYARRDEVAGSVERLARAAAAAGVPVMSHDDMTVAERERFRALGITTAEFPTTEAVTEAAIAAGDATVFGAPNVLRGGSHTGCPTASEMVARGLCTILASDYYYPALVQAPFRLAKADVATLESAWALVSSHPARVLGLTDRGVIADGRRGDLVLIDADRGPEPRVIATLVAGRIRLLTEPERLR